MISGRRLHGRGRRAQRSASQTDRRPLGDAPLAHLLPEAIHLFAIGLAALRMRGVIARGRARPRAGLLAQLLQELRRVGDVARRLERLGQRGEGVTVVAEVDLHAADVDVGAALGAQFLHLAQGLGLGRQEEAVRARGHRPGPRPGGTLVGMPAPGFGERQRLHQAGRDALLALRLAGERGAHAVDRRGRRLSGAGDCCEQRPARTSGRRAIWWRERAPADHGRRPVSIWLPYRRARRGRLAEGRTRPGRPPHARRQGGASCRAARSAKDAWRMRPAAGDAAPGLCAGHLCSRM